MPTRDPASAAGRGADAAHARASCCARGAGSAPRPRHGHATSRSRRDLCARLGATTTLLDGDSHDPLQREILEEAARLTCAAASDGRCGCGCVRTCTSSRTELERGNRLDALITRPFARTRPATRRAADRDERRDLSMIRPCVGARPQRAAGDVDGIVLLDKPAASPPTHALQRVKRLSARRRRATPARLDPLATGMLPMCFGQATKACGRSARRAQGVPRRRLALGDATDTGDAEGEPCRPRRRAAARRRDACSARLARLRRRARAGAADVLGAQARRHSRSTGSHGAA